MDLEKKLIEFYDINKEQLMSYDDVNYRMSKFSLSSFFYLYRKLLPQYINKDNFLFGFDFGILVLKDKLLFLGDKLWIHENFTFIEKIIVIPKEGKIKRDGFQTRVSDIEKLNLFITLKNILLNKNEKITKQFNQNVNIIYNHEIDIRIQLLDFIKKIYQINKSKSFILTQDDLKNKVNEIYIFSKGDIWTGWYNLKLYINDSNSLRSKNGIFGLVSGIYIYNTSIVFIQQNNGDGFGESFELDLSELNTDYNIYFRDNFVTNGKKFKVVTDSEKIFLIYLFKVSSELLNEFKKMKENENRIIQEKKKQKNEEDRKRILERHIIQEENERQRKIKLEETKVSIISELDKDSNNEVDLVDGEIFNKLLINNQKSIIEIDKNYIQKFVKVSIYLKTKRSNIQKIFESIKDTKNDHELNELVNLLKNQIHTYDLLVFHSISMITSLVENELITFFEIHECFDQLGVFNSNWENEVSGKLSDIGNGIKDLMYTIYQMENKIVSSIQSLTYVNQVTFSVLNNSINSQLKNINSSLDYGNYMSKIQNYKMFNISI
jgi:hypothetical protein